MRARLGIPEKAPIILHVGRLDADKCVDRVVQAAAITLQQTPAHFLIVGDGTERENLERLCTRLGIGERSHFPGFIAIKDGLAALYQMAAVFVTASEIETQGLVLLEAAACALPIVAVKATCVHEIVHEGENGFLLMSGDCDGMARRLTWLVQNPSRAHEMGRVGEVIVASHAVENTINAYEDFYQTTILSAWQASPTFSPTAAEPDRAAHSDGCD